MRLQNVTEKGERIGIDAMGGTKTRMPLLRLAWMAKPGEPITRECLID
jgi:hypothetical protein